MLFRYWLTWGTWHVAQMSMVIAATGRTSCVPWQDVQVGVGARAFARRFPCAPSASTAGTVSWQSVQRTRGSRSWGAVAVLWQATHSSPPCAEAFSAAWSTKSASGRPGSRFSRLRPRSA